MFDPGAADELELAEFQASLTDRHRNLIDAIGRPELRELLLLVWLRRVAWNTRRRRELGLKIAWRVRKAHAEGWGDAADRAVLWMPTDRICNGCGRPMHEFKNVPYLAKARKRLGSGAG